MLHFWALLRIEMGRAEGERSNRGGRLSSGTFQLRDSFSREKLYIIRVPMDFLGAVRKEHRACRKICSNVISDACEVMHCFQVRKRYGFLCFFLM